jgi:hypothetical protein
MVRSISLPSVVLDVRDSGTSPKSAARRLQDNWSEALAGQDLRPYSLAATAGVGSRFLARSDPRSPASRRPVELGVAERRRLRYF